jgi:hypothetical protein
MADSIVEIRLTRNLRYKLSYIKIFETYLKSAAKSEIASLLKALIEAQQMAIPPLSRYLRRHDVQVQELALDQRLLDHASAREDVPSQLRFIHDGLQRSVGWYKTQVTDRQMTADPAVRDMLVELGEIDAAKLWRVEAVMGVLKIPICAKERDWSDQERLQPEQNDDWSPRLAEDVGRSAWQGSHTPKWPRPGRYERGDD